MTSTWNSSSPRFSVLTPTRNRRGWIRRATRSVLAQTFPSWELIVYDVGDKGETVDDLLTSFDDPRIRYVRGECQGPAADFQAALELARGEIVTPLSDDDRLPPHALATVDRAFGDGLWLNGRTVFVNEQGDPVALRGGTRDHLEETRDGKFMLGGAVYWRRGFEQTIGGGFDSAFDHGGDHDLYTRFLADVDPVRVPEVLYIYTDHPATDTRVNADKQADASRRVAARVAAGRAA